MILPNNFKLQWADTEADVMQAVKAVGASGWYVLGAQVREFEKELAAFWGLSEAIGVASGLDAIEIGLRVLGCKPGDRVLTTPISAFATTLAIVKLGAVPVFVDVDAWGLIDLKACREVLAKRGDIKFVVPVHLYGHALNSNVLRSLRDDFGCRVVEDCAQSIGASFQGHSTGLTGEVAVTSFYPTKNLGALGDGGAILTNSAAFADASRSLRDYGQSAKYQHTEVGYNSRLDELQAGIMKAAFLPRLQSWTNRRRAVAKAYLGGINNPAIRIPGAPEGSDSCWHLFPVLVAAARKSDFIAHMKAQGVLCGEHYPIAIPRQKAMEQVPFEMIGDCAAAIEWCACEVSLPIHPYLEDVEIQRVIVASNSWSG